MPTNYDFECKKCQHVYEEYTDYDPKGKYPKVKCPNCQSKAKIKLIASSINIGGPTKSKMNNFEYRGGLNMENAKDLRRRATEKEGSASPYNYLPEPERDNY